jgi:Predicted integral membrane protein (DUF2269)
LGLDIFRGPMTLPLAVTSFQVSLSLHISAVMVGFGATFAEAIMFPVAMRVGVKHLPYVHRLQLAINQWLATPALVVVLATGLYQVDKLNLSLGDFWLSAAFAIVIVIGALLGAYFIPTDHKLAPMVEAEIAAAGDREITLSDLSQEYQRRGRMEGIVGAITGVLLIVAVYLMVVKPGA